MQKKRQVVRENVQTVQVVLRFANIKRLMLVSTSHYVILFLVNVKNYNINKKVFKIRFDEITIK